MVAYSSVVHMRLGLSAISSYSLVGIEGRLITSFSHGLTSPIIFYLTYMIYKFTFTRRILLVKGFGSSNPTSIIIHFIFTILSLGVPPRISFFAEFFNSSRIITVLITLTLVLVMIFYFSGFYIFYFYVVASYGARVIEGGHEQISLDLIIVTLSLFVLLWFFLFV